VSPSCTYHLSLSTTCTMIQSLICIKTHNKSDTIYNYGQQKNSGIEYNVMCCKCKIQVGYILKYNVGIWENLVEVEKEYLEVAVVFGNELYLTKYVKVEYL